MTSTSKLIRPLAYLVALVIAAASVLLFWPQNEGDDMYQVTAYFDKTIGLFPNSDVTVLGVPVGKIHAVEPEGNRVKVTLHVSTDQKIPADARAQIVPISVISDRFIELFPAYNGGPVLEDGAVLEEDRTQIPAELDDVFKQLKKLLDAIQPGEPGEPGALGELIVELDETFSGREDDLQGALTEGAELTDTLAETKGDLQNILANLDSLFGQLATRSGDFGTLNRNLISVLTAISESRDDLQGTLVNVADLSAEMTDLSRDQGDLLEDDLRRLTRIVRVLLDNEGSVRESLTWLPVLGWGLNNAYNPEYKSIDVRDNAEAKIDCDILEDIPDILDPIKEILEELCEEETGSGDGTSNTIELPEPPAALQPPDPDMKIDCDQGVKRVRKQLRRIESLGLPDDVKQELLDPLRDRLKRLAKECKDLAEKIEDAGGGLDDVLEEAPDVGDVPDVDDDIDDLTGSAHAGSPVPTSAAREERGWLGDLLGFLGL